MSMPPKKLIVAAKKMAKSVANASKAAGKIEQENKQMAMALKEGEKAAKTAESKPDAGIAAAQKALKKLDVQIKSAELSLKIMKKERKVMAESLKEMQKQL